MGFDDVIKLPDFQVITMKKVIIEYVIKKKGEGVSFETPLRMENSEVLQSEIASAFTFAGSIAGGGKTAGLVIIAIITSVIVLGGVGLGTIFMKRALDQSK